MSPRGTPRVAAALEHRVEGARAAGRDEQAPALGQQVAGLRPGLGVGVHHVQAHVVEAVLGEEGLDALDLAPVADRAGDGGGDHVDGRAHVRLPPVGPVAERSRPGRAPPSTSTPGRGPPSSTKAGRPIRRSCGLDDQEIGLAQAAQLLLGLVHLHLLAAATGSAPSRRPGHVEEDHRVGQMRGGSGPAASSAQLRKLPEQRVVRRAARRPEDRHGAGAEVRRSSVRAGRGPTRRSC